MKNRKGFALVYAVLIGALIFTTVIGLTFRLTTEGRIKNARSYSQFALTTAETGASHVLFDLRNFGVNENNPNEFDPDAYGIVQNYLSKSDVMSIINSSVGDVFDFGEEQYVSSDSTGNESFTRWFHAKLKVLEKDEENKRVKARLGVLGLLKDKRGNVIAREGFEAEFYIVYSITSYTETEEVETKIWVPGTRSVVFNYALFSGGDIVFGGSAQTVTGNIHAIGTIDKGNAWKQVRVGGNGNAEAEVTIIGEGIVTGEEVANAAPVPFPALNVAAYKKLADAFRGGQPPYDGSLGNFPNTSDPLVMAVIQSYLGAPDSSSTLANISSFYADLKAKTGAFAGLTVPQWQNLLNNANAIVYYVEGDVHIKGQFKCIGTLVINGDLKINGNSQIGDPDSCESALLVKGDVHANGTATINGLLYTDKSILGNGTFNCKGSIVARCVEEGTEIEISGDAKVEYAKLTNPNLAVETPGYWDIQTVEVPGETVYYYKVISAGNKTQTESGYTWRQISYDEFISGY